MDGKLQVFSNDVFGNLTVVISGDKPMFVAKEVAEILEYSKTDKMTKRIDPDYMGKNQVPQNGGSGQNRKMTTINEYGLIEAVLGSKKKEAKVFKKWVIEDVIPSVMKNGSYGGIQVPTNFREALLLAADQQLKIEQQQVLITTQSAELDHKTSIITTNVEETDFATMRTLINRIVRMGSDGETIPDRYTAIYTLYREIHHVDLKKRKDRACEVAGKKTLYKSTLDYAEAHGHMRHLYDICVKYYETDVKKALLGMVKKSRRVPVITSQS